MKRQRNSGFILMYVVGLIAAITLLLYQLQMLKTGVPDQAQRQIEGAVQSRESLLLSEFIVAGLVDQNFPVDPRYQQFRRLLAEDPARLSEAEEALAQLKSMLDQMNFRIDLPSKDGSGAKKLGIPIEGSNGPLFIPSLSTTTVTLGNHRYQIRVLPGNALPNLNTLPHESLARYLTYLGINERESLELAANLVDWRDADDFRTAGIGAEREYYAAQTPGYLPRNAPIRNWQELAYVKDVTPDRLRLLRDNFMLGAPANSRTLIDGIKPEALAALTGLRVDIATAILQEYGRLDEKNAKQSNRSSSDIAGLLLTRDAELFDRYITWKPDTTRVRIEITGERSNLTTEYALDSKQVLARW